VWQSLCLPQLHSLNRLPSRSRTADTRGGSIIPQNPNFIYNKFIKKICHCEPDLAGEAIYSLNKEIALSATNASSQ
jgi:hypothetical protein